MRLKGSGEERTRNARSAIAPKKEILHAEKTCFSPLPGISVPSDMVIFSIRSRYPPKPTGGAPVAQTSFKPLLLELIVLLRVQDLVDPRVDHIEDLGVPLLHHDPVKLLGERRAGDLELTLVGLVL